MIDKEVAERMIQEARRDSGERQTTELTSEQTFGLNLFTKLAASKVRNAFGNEVGAFYDYAHEVDWDHPENDLELVPASLYSLISAVVDVVDYASRYQNCEFIKPMVDDVRKKKDYKSLKMFSSPSGTLKGVRYLKDEQAIRKARLLKEVQDVGLRVLYNRGRSAYDKCPETLDCYCRFASSFDEELAETENRRDFFEGHGLTSMSKVIAEAIEEIKNRIAENEILGFKKVSMRDVAATLSKMMGLRWESRIYDDSNREYAPISCPYHVLEPHANEDFKGLIQHLDSIPEFDGKPLFDHFWIVIPSFQGGEGDDGFTMVREGKAVGALLGDRDGEVFFICYWTQECYK